VIFIPLKEDAFNRASANRHFSRHDFDLVHVLCDLSGVFVVEFFVDEIVKDVLHNYVFNRVVSNKEWAQLFFVEVHEPLDEAGVRKAALFWLLVEEQVGHCALLRFVFLVWMNELFMERYVALANNFKHRLGSRHLPQH
jgi:hypothetical protein